MHAEAWKAQTRGNAVRGAAVAGVIRGRMREGPLAGGGWGQVPCSALEGAAGPWEPPGVFGLSCFGPNSHVSAMLQGGPGPRRRVQTG